MKKCQNTTLAKWVFEEEKIKPMTSKPLYTSFHRNQSHCANQGIEKHSKVFERQSVCLEWSWRQFPGRGAYTEGRGAHRATTQCKFSMGGAHTQGMAHWVWRVAHTHKGPKSWQISSNCLWNPSNWQVGSISRLSHQSLWMIWWFLAMFNCHKTHKTNHSKKHQNYGG